MDARGKSQGKKKEDIRNRTLLYCITSWQEAVTHVKRSISWSARWDSASAILSPSPAEPSSRMLRNAALPWTTFGQASPPSPSTPFEMPPHAHSSSDSVRARMGPPPPPFVSRRASYASVAESVSVAVALAGPVAVGKGERGSRRSKLKPA